MSFSSWQWKELTLMDRCWRTLNLPRLVPAKWFLLLLIMIHLSCSFTVMTPITSLFCFVFFFCSSTMPSNSQLGVSITSALIITASAANFPKTWRQCLQVQTPCFSWPLQSVFLKPTFFKPMHVIHQEHEKQNSSSSYHEYTPFN